MVSMVYRSAILQTAATDEMRGRMQGVFTVVVAGGPRIADLVHGWAAAGVGTVGGRHGRRRAGDRADRRRRGLPARVLALPCHNRIVSELAT